MNTTSFKERKVLNIEEEISNQRSGLHYIELHDQEQLDSILKELYMKELFDKYNMSYSYTVHDDYIALVLYKTFDFIE